MSIRKHRSVGQWLSTLGQPCTVPKHVESSRRVTREERRSLVEGIEVLIVSRARSHCLRRDGCVMDGSKGINPNVPFKKLLGTFCSVAVNHATRRSDLSVLVLAYDVSFPSMLYVEFCKFSKHVVRCNVYTQHKLREGVRASKTGWGCEVGSCCG